MDTWNLFLKVKEGGNCCGGLLLLWPPTAVLLLTPIPIDATLPLPLMPCSCSFLTLAGVGQFMGWMSPPGC